MFRSVVNTNIYQLISYIALYWALKGVSPLFEQIWILISKACIYPTCTNFGWN